MSAPSNEYVGQLLGVSHASVSRYKSGDRLPELDTMAQIAQVFAWPLDDQYQARQNGTYADEFAKRVNALADRPAVGTVVQEKAENQQASKG